MGFSDSVCNNYYIGITSPINFSCRTGKMHELISFGLIPTSDLSTEEEKYVSYCGAHPLSKMQLCTAKYLSNDFHDLWAA